MCIRNRNRVILKYQNSEGFNVEVERGSTSSNFTIIKGSDPHEGIIEIDGNQRVNITLRIGDFFQRQVEIDKTIKPLKIDNLEMDDKKIAGKIVGGSNNEKFELHFFQNGSWLAEYPLKKRDFEVLNKTINKYISDNASLQTGIYNLSIYGKTTGMEAELPKKYTYDAPTNWSGLLLSIFGFTALLGIGFGLYRWNEQNKSVSDEVKIKINENRGNSSAHQSENESVEDEASSSDVKVSLRSKIRVSASKKNLTGAIVGSTTMVASQKLVNYQLELVTESPKFLSDHLKPNKYRIIRLNKFWRNSIVSDIYMHENCAARIHNWVFKDNYDLHIVNEKADQIPEIGGWILGKVDSQAKDGSYRVSFEKFVEIHPEDNSQTAIAFGPMAMIKLEEQLERYGDDFEIVGWFHTHPGWGVFLSGDDINLHQTLFKKGYQVAMELDSLRNNNEVGYFTRRYDGKLNNKNDQIRPWDSWELYKEWIKES